MLAEVDGATPVSMHVAGNLNNALSTSSLTTGAVFLIVQQFSSRGLTFIVNQILLRYISPELLGTATQLEVYSITVLSFSRESLRIALQRQADVADDRSTPSPRAEAPPGFVNASSAAGRTQAIVNLAYLSVGLGVLFICMIGWIYVRILSGSRGAVLDTPYFAIALRLYGIAAFVELLAEPYYIVAQQKARFSVRARAESISTALRCFVTCASVIWSHHIKVDTGVLSFALGQIVFSSSLLAVYAHDLAKLSAEGGFSLGVSKIHSSEQPFILSYFSYPILSLSASFFSQALFKQVLTQGDILLIASLATTSAQGTYALATNYGGLAARLLLQPVEEMSRNFFGKLLASSRDPPPQKAILSAQKILCDILRIYMILSVLIVSIGPTTAPLCLSFVAGSKWRDAGAGEVLSTYCYYIPLLAINGLMEAFVASVANETEVHRQTAWMLSFLIGFACGAILFLKVLGLGAEGLVWANALTMVFRIVWCSRFIRLYFLRWNIEIKIHALIPRPLSIAAGSIAYAILRQMNPHLGDELIGITKCATIASFLLIIVAISERAQFSDCYQQLRSKS